MGRKFLIIEARFYDDIMDSLVEGAVGQLEKSDFNYERIEVPGVLEIPSAITLAENTGRFLGFVALGCVIRGETSHYDTVCVESARGLMQLSIDRQLAIGNGILTVENKEQAWERALMSRKNRGGNAAFAAIRMLSIKEHFSQ